MASINDWGLTDRGFRRPSYSELLDAYERKARQLFGEKPNLTVRSPLGVFLRIFAWFSSLAFGTLEAVYNSRFIDTAVGTSLYNLGRTFGLRVLAAQKASGYLRITGTPGTVIPVGWLASNNAGIQFAVVSRGVIDATGQVLVAVQAVQAGPDGNVPADTVTTITNPGIPSGIESVTNPAPTTGGRNRETDEQYRDRYYKSVDFAGGVNRDAIRAEILQSVEGVQSAVVYENDTDFPDPVYGLPPHSFEAVVFGGLDGAIGQAIARRKAAGIQTYGNTAVPVLDEAGEIYDIHFSRPTPVDAWVRIDNLKTNDTTFPLDGLAQIRAALVNYIGGDGGAGLSIGETLFYYRLPEIVYRVSGVVDFDLSISPDGETWGRDNIVISSREKAVTSEEQVIIS